MNVLSVSGLNVTVSRFPGAAVSHASGAMVLAGPPNLFFGYNPTGATDGPATPWVNVYTGQQWLYSSVTGTWVPGFGNTQAPLGVTTLVASTAGLITPSGPLFHVNGTAAITGITVPVGAANGANPIPIIVPCHRVIGSDGSLTDFDGKLPLKKRLLELESRQLSFL